MQPGGRQWIGAEVNVGAFYLHDSPAYGTGQPRLVNWEALPNAAGEIFARIKMK